MSQLACAGSPEAARVMSVRDDASIMPSLDAFDEEFAHDESEAEDTPPRLNRGFRFSTLIGLALAAGLITAIALGWPNISGVSDPAEKPEAIIERLTRELEALKQENKELAEAQQQASESVGSLQAAQQEQRAPFTSWYSDVAGLTFGIPTQEGATNGRRSATARPRPREVPRRDDAGPISLDPQ